MKRILPYVYLGLVLTFILQYKGFSKPELLEKKAVLPGGPTVWKWKLDNGLTVLTLPDFRNPMASIRIALHAGSNREIPGETGLAHFFEHMMFRKTKGYPEGYFNDVLAKVGGKGNAFTGPAYVVYLSDFPAPALGEVLSADARRFTDLDLVDPYFSIEKGAVISERKLRYENNPLMLGFEKITAWIEKDTPYEWMTIGTKKDVQDMSLKSAQKFYETYYRPQNAILALGGPFDAQTAVHEIERTFGQWKKGQNPPELLLPQEKTPLKQAGKEIVCRESVFEQEFELVYPGFKRDKKEFIMAKAFEWLLNEHPEGTWLHRLQAQKMANAFSIEKRSWRKDYAPLEVQLSLPRQVDHKQVIQAWQTELNAVLKRKFSNQVKQKLLRSIELSQAARLEKMSVLLEHIYWQEFMFGQFDYWKDESEIAEKITDSEIKAWMKTNLIDNPYYVSGVTGREPYSGCSTQPL